MSRARKSTAPLFAAVAAVACAVLPCRAQAPATPPPRLAVLVVVDQLARWVFDAGLPHLAEGGGFRRLLARGVSFAHCAYAHACTETGPGHATLGTGADARTHGIVKNEWYDPATGGKVYCVSDTAGAPLPQWPEAKGRGPGRLLVPTVADLLRAQSPHSRILSIAHKDRSAILMGGRGADACVWFENGTGNFVTNTIWGTAPAWLEALDAKRPADRWFGWRWERSGADAAYADCIDDRPFEMAHPSNGARTLPVAVRGGKHEQPGPSFWFEAYLSPIANELVLQAALAALEHEPLGEDDVPDLLCVSFPANDTVGHYFCPDSVEARDTLLRLDVLLGRLLDALDAKVGAGHYALVLSADHGVGLPPEVAKAKGLGGGRGLLHTRARAAAEQALREHFGAPDGSAPFVAYAGEYSLSLDRARLAVARPADEANRVYEEACGIAAAAVGKVEGVRCGYAVPELLAHDAGDDALRRALLRATLPGRGGDVAFVVEPYWLEAGIPASHGTPHPYDTDVPLLAFGPGLAGGSASMAAVTPGLAAVLLAHWLALPRPEAASDELPPDLFVR